MHIQNVPRHDVSNEISGLMSIPELSESLLLLRWHKSLDKNGVSPNAVKVLEIEFKSKLLNFTNLWLCDETVSYPSWLTGLIKALPKKGKLLDLSNWRGIVLMDIVSKVVSVFVNVRLQKLMKIRGLPFQFGATPKLGCQDAVFVLKAFLQERREKMLDTWVAFVDLIKAYDSVQHRVIDATLEIFGVPTDVRSWVRRLYDGSTLEINVGKTNKIITY